MADLKNEKLPPAKHGLVRRLSSLDSVPVADSNAPEKKDGTKKEPSKKEEIKKDDRKKSLIGKSGTTSHAFSSGETKKEVKGKKDDKPNAVRKNISSPPAK